MISGYRWGVSITSVLVNWGKRTYTNMTTLPLNQVITFWYWNTIIHFILRFMYILLKFCRQIHGLSMNWFQFLSIIQITIYCSPSNPQALSSTTTTTNPPTRVSTPVAVTTKGNTRLHSSTVRQTPPPVFPQVEETTLYIISGSSTSDDISEQVTDSMTTQEGMLYDTIYNSYMYIIIFSNMHFQTVLWHVFVTCVLW